MISFYVWSGVGVPDVAESLDSLRPDTCIDDALSVIERDFRQPRWAWAYRDGTVHNSESLTTTYRRTWSVTRGRVSVPWGDL